jgi:hypothetical protein
MGDHRADAMEDHEEGVAGESQDIEDELGGQMESAPIILAVKVSAKASEARNVGVFCGCECKELGVSEF